MNDLRIIQNILHITPKGSYYESSGEQLESVMDRMDKLFEKDRTLFTCSTLLDSTDYAKGVMAHRLLNNPLLEDDLKGDELMEKWDTPVEDLVILYNMRNMGVARAIKNLLFMAGREDGIKFDRVNNTRTRKIITNYVFGRSDESLESLIIKFRSKLSKLLKHALGWYDLNRILDKKEGYRKRLRKYFKPIDNSPKRFFDEVRVRTVLGFLFNQDVSPSLDFRKFDLYNELLELAKKRDSEGFRDKIKKNSKEIPVEVMEGLRNNYQLDVDLNEVMKHSHMTNSQKVQRQRVSKGNNKRKQSVEVKVDWKKRPIKEIIKYIFSRYQDGEDEIITSEIEEAFNHRKEVEKLDINFGDDVLILLDKSDSMKGSKKRPLHPIINGLSIAHTLGVDDDRILDIGGKDGIYPAGGTNLAEGLLRAVKKDPDVDVIIVISDGYENTVSGMFNHVYDELQDRGYDFDVVHINPIFASNVEGTRLIDDVEPILVDSNKALETHMALSMLNSKPELARKLFMDKLRPIIGGDIDELIG